MPHAAAMRAEEQDRAALLRVRLHGAPQADRGAHARCARLAVDPQRLPQVTAQAVCLAAAGSHACACACACGRGLARRVRDVRAPYPRGVVCACACICAVIGRLLCLRDSCKGRKEAKCGGIFKKKALSQLCVCGLLQGDHEGPSHMFALGFNAVQSTETGGSDAAASESREVHADDGLVSAAFVSPRRHSAAPMGVPSEHSVPLNQRPAPRLIRAGMRAWGSSSLDADQADSLDAAADRLPGGLDRSASMPHFESPPPADHPEELSGSVFDYYSIQADSRDPKPGVFPPPTFDTIPAVTDENEGQTGLGLDAQLLPEEAELLRREVEAQRRMLHEHDSKLREQHGELVELTEEKKRLEMQMESTVNHVVKVMSQEKKRLSERIEALEQDKAHVVNSNRQLQGLINAMGSDLQGTFRCRAFAR